MRSILGSKIVKKILLFIGLIIAFLLVISLSRVLAQEGQIQEETLEAVVTQIINQEQIQFEGQDLTYQEVELLITDGSLEDEKIILDSESIQLPGSAQLSEGDKVVVMKIQGFEGEDNFYVTDLVRRDRLITLFIFFALLSILVGGINGAMSLVGMLFSFAVIFQLIVPQIISGSDPILAAIVGSLLIIPVTFYLSHGFNTKTHLSIAGTLITLILTGIIAKITIDYTYLSGFSSEEAVFLQLGAAQNINIKGLLLAGIIIASLGILDDITISQTSTVNELKNANKKLRQNDLFKRAMRVGRDHIASLVNTLILVYAGASLPLILLFMDSTKTFAEVVNYEIVAEELVRMMVGSIGLILAVPITTVLAAYHFGNKK